jgi:hypothetical protein
MRGRFPKAIYRLPPALLGSLTTLAAFDVDVAVKATREPVVRSNIGEELRNLPPHGRKRRDRAALLTQEGKTLTVVGPSKKVNTL